MIFAREISDDLTSLVKKIDAETGKNKSARMGSFVVFLSTDEGMEEKLKDLVKKEGLKHTILTLDNPAGPRAYNITKDADVTVVLYNKRTASSKRRTSGPSPRTYPRSCPASNRSIRFDPDEPEPPAPPARPLPRWRRSFARAPDPRSPHAPRELKP